MELSVLVTVRGSVGCLRAFPWLSPRLSLASASWRRITRAANANNARRRRRGQCRRRLRKGLPGSPMSISSTARRPARWAFSQHPQAQFGVSSGRGAAVSDLRAWPLLNRNVSLRSRLRSEDAGVCCRPDGGCGKPTHDLRTARPTRRRRSGGAGEDDARCHPRRPGARQSGRCPSAPPRGAEGARADLRALGVYHVQILTGQNERLAATATASLGIAYRANLLPGNKIAVVQDYQARGHTVVMEGDDVNDARALAKGEHVDDGRMEVISV